MPQWQFKLLDFDIKDDYDKNMEYVPGKDNKRFIVQMFGIDEEGKTASIFVRGFDPFFYVKVGDNWSNGDMMELVSYIKKEIGTYYENSLYKWQIVKRHKLYGFDNLESPLNTYSKYPVYLQSGANPLPVAIPTELTGFLCSTS